ncbi:hypothetical protein ACTXT7_012850 [Hymenolepis weldensis]
MEHLLNEDKLSYFGTLEARRDIEMFYCLMDCQKPLPKGAATCLILRQERPHSKEFKQTKWGGNGGLRNIGCNRRNQVISVDKTDFGGNLLIPEVG